MARKLTYFEWNGLGEPIRYILMYTGKQFEDIRIDFKTWVEGKQELTARLPFGKLPVFEEDGKIVNQAMAIIRYVVSDTDLLPSDPWEQAILDATAQTAYYDFFSNHVLSHVFEFDPVRKNENRKKFYDESLDYYFSRFEKQLNEHNGCFGGKLSWVDFFVVGLIECANSYLKDNIEKNYPLISELVKKIHSLPRVKEYVKNRKPYIAYHLENM